MASLTRLIALLAATAVFSTAAAAQTPPVSKIDRKTPSGSIRIPARLPELVPARGHASDDRVAAHQAAATPKHHAMGFAIAAGIGAGVAVAGVAAAKYGENEGSCPRCFVVWSSIAAPVGAGVGAAVGYLIDRVRR